MTATALFDHVPACVDDPIMTLMAMFGADTRPAKASLCIGVYLDDAGRLPLLPSVRQAELDLVAEGAPKAYLPMEGLAGYRAVVQSLLFGAKHEAVTSRRVATVQTPGGSGALKIGADFLRQQFPDASVWVSDPTWDNHHAIFEGSGFRVGNYPYYDPATRELRFAQMLEAINALPRHSIVLLHASCHNPTGVDLSPAQWMALAAVLAQRDLIPFVDMAYQGFGEGLGEDAFALGILAAAGLQFLVANSFSKNFSLYGERCGGLSVVCANETHADAVLGQLKAMVRRNYATPPIHGARVVTHILQSPALSLQWAAETGQMRRRIRSMREELHRALAARFDASPAFDYLLKQRGMFSYTGLSEQQVDRLRERHGVYLVRTGRLCLSGLTAHNVDHVADAIADVLGSAGLAGNVTALQSTRG